MQPCRTVDEAIERANRTKYGLAAGIVTKSLDVANRVSRSVRAGGHRVGQLLLRLRPGRALRGYTR